MDNSWKNNNFLIRMNEEYESFEKEDKQLTYNKMSSAEKSKFRKLIDNLDQFTLKMHIDDDLKGILLNTRKEVSKRLYTSIPLPVNKVVYVLLNTSTYDPSGVNKLKGSYTQDVNGNYRDIRRDWYIYKTNSIVEGSIGIEESSAGIQNQLDATSFCALGWSDGEKFHIIGSTFFERPSDISDEYVKKIIPKVFTDEFVEALLASKWDSEVDLGKNYNSEEALDDIKRHAYILADKIIEVGYCLDLNSVNNIISYFTEDFVPVHFASRKNPSNRWYDFRLEDFEEKIKKFMVKNNLK